VHVATVTTSDHTLLRNVRETIAAANDVLLCVAFVHERGLHLLKEELEAARKRDARARLVVTTAFETTTRSALALARECGLEVRVLNPGSGSTYHPKLYLGARGSSSRAVIGSANLTGGLATNLEVGVALRGRRHEDALCRAWEWGEALWNDPRGANWLPSHVSEPRLEPLCLELYALITAARRVNETFMTLGPRPRPNRVTEVTFSEVYIETARSRTRRGTPEAVPAWMFNLAWDHLKAHGALTNTTLLDILRVHRSSAVFAILGRLPPVEAVQGRNMALKWRSVPVVP
jgi:hypothetical protein